MKGAYLFDSFLKWENGKKTVIKSTEVNENIPIAIPGAFTGERENRWSPEHLLTGALGSCIIATYLFYAKKYKLQLSSIDCSTVAKAEMINDTAELTGIDLHCRILLEDGSNEETAKEIFDLTTQTCLVSKALRVPVIYHPEIKVEKAIVAIDDFII